MHSLGVWTVCSVSGTRRNGVTDKLSAIQLSVNKYISCCFRVMVKGLCKKLLDASMHIPHARGTELCNSLSYATSHPQIPQTHHKIAEDLVRNRNLPLNVVHTLLARSPPRGNLDSNRTVLERSRFNRTLHKNYSRAKSIYNSPSCPSLRFKRN
jgi:hypothetical protein